MAKFEISQSEAVSILGHCPDDLQCHITIISYLDLVKYLKDFGVIASSRRSGSQDAARKTALVFFLALSPN